MSLTSTVILLVEDEFLVQDLIETALQDGGYTVVAADTGKAALEILDREAADLGGLVTDVNLGRAPNGWEVATRAREINPALPVVYVTGDSAHEWAAYGVPNSLLVMKPFVPSEILVGLANLRAAAAAAPPPD